MNILCKCISPKLNIFTKCYRFSTSKPPTWRSTVPFKPPINSGYVIKVYDGDTITVASKLPYSKSPMYRWSVRIRGIDCPELRTKDETEKTIAKIAQKSLSEMILNKTVDLKNVDTGKYGRVLADVYYKKTNITDFMIINRLAVPYFGKTKKTPKSWLNYYNGNEHLDIELPKKYQTNNKNITTKTKEIDKKNLLEDNDFEVV